MVWPLDSIAGRKLLLWHEEQSAAKQVPLPLLWWQACSQAASSMGNDRSLGLGSTMMTTRVVALAHSLLCNAKNQGPEP